MTVKTEDLLSEITEALYQKRMTTPTTASMSNNSEVDYTIYFKVKLFKNILGEKHASIH